MKKRLVISLILMALIENLSAQFDFNFQNKTGSDLYARGTQLIEIGDYKGADSLLTMAMCTYKDENVYFNRAVAKLYQTDTIGSCTDLNVASNRYFDVEASALYHQICCKSVDTVFYDTKFNTSDPSHFRYYEVILKPKYSSEISGTYHDTRISKDVISVDYGCENSIISLGTRSTDIIGSYLLIDSVKFFNVASKPVSCFKIDEYNDLKRRGEIVLKAKYSNLKIENSLETIKVYFEIKVSNSGDVLGVKYIGTYPKIELGIIENELEKDVISIVNNYPKLIPAVFHGEKVNFITYDFISF